MCPEGERVLRGSHLVGLGVLLAFEMYVVWKFLASSIPHLYVLQSGNVRKLAINISPLIASFISTIAIESSLVSSFSKNNFVG